MNKIYREILKNLTVFAIIIVAIIPGIAITENINPTPTPSSGSNDASPTYNINNETVNDLNKIGLNKEIELNKENQIIVTAYPLWTHTGLYVNVGDTIHITANGWWTYDNYHWFGPDGVSTYSTDIFYRYANLGELIAFVGPDPYQGNWGNGNFFPQFTGYWAIGSSGQFVSDKNGILWLGINDDAVSKDTGNNFGSVTADITIGTSTITVTSPNGGENWQIGTTNTITWTKSGTKGSYVNIDLYKAGIYKQTIVASTPNDGSHPWTIPTTLTLGNDYKIKITSTSNSAYNDMSDNNFVISTSSIIDFKLPLSGQKSWLLTVQARDGKTLWPGVVDQYHIGKNALDFDDITKEDGQLTDVAIISPANGQVSSVGTDSCGGNYVKIKHNNGLITQYFHLKNYVVNIGDYVITGQKIGIMGNTGSSSCTTGSHVHFEILPSTATNFLIEGKTIDSYKVGTTSQFIYYLSSNVASYLLKNPGFEESYNSLPRYWNRYQTGTKAVFTYPEIGRAGTGKSVSIKYATKETGKVASWLQQGIVVSPNGQYKLSGYMKLQGVTGSTATPRPGGASIRVAWYKSDGKLIKTDVINKKGTIGWTKYEAVFKTPSNAVKATVAGDLFDSSGKVWFDDLSFVRIS